MHFTEYEFFSQNFENQLEEQIQKIRSEYADLSIKLTGNAFVDAGIYAVSILQNTSHFEITLGDVLETITSIDGKYDQGKSFALRNARIKSTSKVLFNNPLNQPAYGGTSKKKTGYFKAPSKAEPSPLQERLYIAYLVEFMISYGQDKEISSQQSQCLICGNYTDFDFNELETTLKILAGDKPLEKKDDFGSGPTRTWIPLLGSTSSIQSLPGFTEPNIVCGKCLTLSQFLPQVCDLQNGKLTLYQSSDHDFAKEFYRTNLKTFQEMHETIPLAKKLEIVGADSWDYYINNLMRIITDNITELHSTNLILWKFDNYGTDPALEYVHLPNRTLQFLYQVIIKYDGSRVIKNFIRIEEEKKLFYQTRLFNCIEGHRDYILFYPHTKYEIEQIIPQIIYEIYQVYIRDWSFRDLITVRTIAEYIKKNPTDEIDTDELLRVLKSRTISDLRRFITPYILLLLDDDVITVHDILGLFEHHSDIVNDQNPWKLFQYYLHPNLTIIDTELDVDPITLIIDPDREEYLKLIQRVAEENTTRHQNLSSFERSSFLNNLSRYNFSDFEEAYLLAGLKNAYLTWDKLEILQTILYRHEILFYFRLSDIRQTIFRFSTTS